MERIAIASKLINFASDGRVTDFQFSRFCDHPAENEFDQIKSKSASFPIFRERNAREAPAFGMRKQRGQNENSICFEKGGECRSSWKSVRCQRKTRDKLGPITIAALVSLPGHLRFEWHGRKIESQRSEEEKKKKSSYRSTRN